MTAAPHVLVIDDDSDMRILMGALLEHLGARVTTAGDALELDAALAQPPDLVLLDLVMPTGVYDACVDRLVARGVAAPICVLSGSTSGTLAQACARLGAKGLHTTTSLTKPARLDALAALIETLPSPADTGP